MERIAQTNAAQTMPPDARRTNGPTVVSLLPALPTWRDASPAVYRLLRWSVLLMFCGYFGDWLIRLLAPILARVDPNWPRALLETYARPDGRYVMTFAPAAVLIVLAGLFALLLVAARRRTRRRRAQMLMCDPDLRDESEHTDPELARSCSLLLYLAEMNARLVERGVDIRHGLIVAEPGTLPPYVPSERPAPVRLRVPEWPTPQGLMLIVACIAAVILVICLDGLTSSRHYVIKVLLSPVTLLAAVFMYQYALTPVCWRVAAGGIERVHRRLFREDEVERWLVGPQTIFVVTGIDQAPSSSNVVTGSVLMLTGSRAAELRFTGADTRELIWQALLYAQSATPLPADQLLAPA
jgi:hypothetical protein